MADRERDRYSLPRWQSSFEVFKTLDQFLHSGWFSRVWVLQELAVSRQPLLVLPIDPPFEMSWLDFSETIKFAEGLDMPQITKGAGLHRLAVFTLVRQQVQRRQLLPLLEMLHLTGNLNATDPRDKIYAVLGIKSSYHPSGEPNVEPDYTVTTEQVYEEVARRMLLRARTAPEQKYERVPVAMLRKTYLDILNVPHLRDDHDPKDLPSWTPDWRGKISSKQKPFLPELLGNIEGSPGQSGRLIFFQNFSAASQTYLLHNDFLVDGKMLRLRGFIVSTIESFGDEHIYIAYEGGDDIRLEQKILNKDEKIC